MQAHSGRSGVGFHISRNFQGGNCQSAIGRTIKRVFGNNFKARFRILDLLINYLGKNT